MNRYLRNVITEGPDAGYGYAVEPTESFGRADHWNTESEKEHNDAYDAFMDHIASLPGILVHPSYLENHKVGFLPDDWEEGYEVKGEIGWYQCSKVEYDTEWHSDHRKVIVPRSTPIDAGEETNESWLRNQLSPVLNIFAMQDVATIPNDLFNREVVKAYDCLERIVKRLPKYPLTDLEEKGREFVCESCGGPNPVWSANNELWNNVNGSPNGILCPTCFIQKCNDVGINMFGVFPSTHPTQGEDKREGNPIVTKFEKAIKDLEYDISVDKERKNRWYIAGLEKAIRVLQSYVSDKKKFPTTPSNKEGERKGVECTLDAQQCQQDCEHKSDRTRCPFVIQPAKNKQEGERGEREAEVGEMAEDFVHRYFYPDIVAKGPNEETDSMKNFVTNWLIETLLPARSTRGKDAVVLDAMVEALRDADEYLSHETYENGKSVYKNNIGAFSFLHKKMRKALTSKPHNPIL